MKGSISLRQQGRRHEPIGLPIPFRTGRSLSGWGHRPLAAMVPAPASATIAIVEDDPIVRNSLGSLIRSFGYRISLFACAEDFLASPPDGVGCLISDITMPGMSGLELQVAVKVRMPKMPVLLLTAFPDPRIRDRAMASGARMFLEKPVDPDDLHAILHRILEDSDKT
ncbi:response regulator transcription factor [Azospirillum sp.]|uniref:response regulator transcription factor n=1 Tax=Azospirillum sp. TaxID=34012 RepID=UPI002D4FFE07|nr:response regulator [Azospirillum sp.]HYF88506.1 response regulator [Azospirillum sp.]